MQHILFKSSSIFTWACFKIYCFSNIIFHVTFKTWIIGKYFFKHFIFFYFFYFILLSIVFNFYYFILVWCDIFYFHLLSFVRCNIQLLYCSDVLRTSKFAGSWQAYLYDFVYYCCIITFFTNVTVLPYQMTRDLIAFTRICILRWMLIVLNKHQWLMQNCKICF